MYFRSRAKIKFWETKTNQPTFSQGFPKEIVMNQDSNELSPSVLGTKDYWDSAYQVEIDNFKNHGDVGEVWFGHESASRIIRWLSNTDIVSKNDPIVDIGCGNGILLMDLADEGFTNLTGVDYSVQAVELSKQIASNRRLNEIKFLACDVVADEILLGVFAVVLDKGTYDAISLNPENALAQRNAYKNNLIKILRPNGLFLIVSCNWTEEELKHQFENELKPICVIPAPKFQFGGKVGNSVTSIVFQKR